MVISRNLVLKVHSLTSGRHLMLSLDWLTVIMSFFTVLVSRSWKSGGIGSQLTLHLWQVLYVSNHYLDTRLGSRGLGHHWNGYDHLHSLCVHTAGGDLGTDHTYLSTKEGRKAACTWSQGRGYYTAGVNVLIVMRPARACAMQMRNCTSDDL